FCGELHIWRALFVDDFESNHEPETAHIPLERRHFFLKTFPQAISQESDAPADSRVEVKIDRCERRSAPDWIAQKSCGVQSFTLGFGPRSHHFDSVDTRR